MTAEAGLNGQLLAQLRDLDLPEPWVAVLGRVPRHLFLPDRVWHLHNGELLPVDRTVHPGGWLEVAYSPDPIVTQLDSQGTPTSSCSMPEQVLRMLDLLDVTDGHTVLEIGTGTGWNAALLAARLGDDQVVTVEVDPLVAEQARNHLAYVGTFPQVVVADGDQGWPAGAPYDRIISTCAVYRVPAAWVAQTSQDGVIVTAWDSPLGLGALVRLTVDGGSASGQFVADASFMWSRSQRFDPPDEPDDFPASGSSSTATVDVDAVRDNLARFVIGMLVPDCRAAGFYTDEVWLLAADSWAVVDMTSGVVRQLGRRRLWDEVEEGWRWWVAAGRPGLTRFGMTVATDRQWLWLDSPDLPLPTFYPTKHY